MDLVHRIKQIMGIALLAGFVGTCSFYLISDGVYRVRYREGNLEMTQDSLLIKRYGSCILDNHKNCFSHTWEVIEVIDKKSRRLYKFVDRDNDGASDFVEVYDALKGTGLVRTEYKKLNLLDNSDHINKIYKVTRKAVEQKLREIENISY